MIIVVLALALGYFAVDKFLLTPGREAARVAQAAPNELKPVLNPKSIAVLPFENLSDDKQNAYFAEGVQDEILTYLAKIADLKVISRTSVMQYKGGTARNLREIGQQLGVSHVLEGSVQRAGGKVRVNAQLIDARTDGHLWAEKFDRPLDDVFAIQSEIAKAIADQLHAKISPSEKAAIERKPTSDLAAFEFYTRGKTLIDLYFNGENRKEDLLQAIDFLSQAVERDPVFVTAYCALAHAHNALYLLGQDHTADRLALGQAAVDTAVRLAPDSGETRLAVAFQLYTKLEYDRAREEVAAARRTLPNNPRTFELSGYINRRQGRWEEARGIWNTLLSLTRPMWQLSTSSPAPTKVCTPMPPRLAFWNGFSLSNRATSMLESAGPNWNFIGGPIPGHCVSSLRRGSRRTRPRPRSWSRFASPWPFTNAIPPASRRRWRIWVIGRGEEMPSDTLGHMAKACSRA